MNNLKRKVKYFYRGMRGLKKIWNLYNMPQYKKNRASAELIRNTHSIEKGLSIEKIRLGFGHAKQKEMIDLMLILRDSTNEVHKEAVSMAVGAIFSYIKYHEENKYTDDFIESMKKFMLENNFLPSKKIYGGTIHLSKKDMCFNITEIEKMFTTRHSVRDFDNKDIDISVLKKALQLAQTSPSACNRQGVRAYILGHDKADNLKGWLEGIGGFEKVIKKFILITGQYSAYRIEESYQYIVSASMYAAYLTLTLHTYGLGACVVQRPVIWTKEWEAIRKKLSIPQDEQAICILGVGNLKESFVVPISHRLDSDSIYKFL